MSNLERMRSAQAKAKAQKLLGSEYKPQVYDHPAQVITHVCGHARALHDVTAENCPECRRAKRKAARPARLDRKQGRLPHESWFHLSWDAKRQLWDGALVIPGGVELAAEAAGVFRLLVILDGLYREHLRKEKAGQ